MFMLDGNFLIVNYLVKKSRFELLIVRLINLLYHF